MAEEKESKPAFKDGDLVVLKSGGPTMTISDCSNLQSVQVVWFEKNTPKNAFYPAVVLKHYEEPTYGAYAI